MADQGKILVVEDSMFHVAAYQSVLEEQPEGSVLYAASVAHALSYLRFNRDISLVLLDLQFPQNPHGGAIDPFAGRKVLAEINKAKQEVAERDVALGYLAYRAPYVVGMSSINFFENGEMPQNQGMVVNLGKDFLGSLCGNIDIFRKWLRTAPLRTEDLPLTAQKWQKHLESLKP